MNQSMLKFALALAVFGGGSAAVQAALFSSSWNNVNLEVPDAPVSGDPVTVSDTRSVTTGFGAGGSGLTDLFVSLQLAGSDGAGGTGTMWNGDLYVTLTHQSGASLVLLNRIGRDPGATSGNSGSGFDVTLDSSALVDIHLPGNGPISGTYQPSGRSENSITVTTASPRDATVLDLLATLGTASPDGLWTLSVTDMESGGLARLNGWGMTLTLTVVPEPSDYAIFAGAGLVAFGFFRRLGRR